MGSQLAAIRAQPHGGDHPVSSPPGALTPTGQTVLARVCDAGHPSPPQWTRCHLCGLDLLGEASRVSRPTLGRIVLSTGSVIELDRPVVVGRKPRVSRVQGADLPRLVTVPSPQQDISRSHLDIRIEEWHVLVVDLGTTNGTILQRPGQPHRRLHPNESVMIRSADVVDIGDGVTITFEAIP
jgi:FHA domain